jgi:hypothetical protein
MRDPKATISQPDGSATSEEREREWEADEQDRAALLEAWKTFRERHPNRRPKWSHEVIEEERALIEAFEQIREYHFAQVELWPIDRRAAPACFSHVAALHSERRSTRRLVAGAGRFRTESARIIRGSMRQWRCLSALRIAHPDA